MLLIVYFYQVSRSCDGMLLIVYLYQVSRSCNGMLLIVYLYQDCHLLTFKTAQDNCIASGLPLTNIFITVQVVTPR